MDFDTHMIVQLMHLKSNIHAAIKIHANRELYSITLLALQHVHSSHIYNVIDIHLLWQGLREGKYTALLPGLYSLTMYCRVLQRASQLSNASTSKTSITGCSHYPTATTAAAHTRIVVCKAGISLGCNVQDN